MFEPTQKKERTSIYQFSSGFQIDDHFYYKDNDLNILLLVLKCSL